MNKHREHVGLGWTHRSGTQQVSRVTLPGIVNWLTSQYHLDLEDARAIVRISPNRVARLMDQGKSSMEIAGELFRSRALEIAGERSRSRQQLIEMKPAEKLFRSRA